MGDTGKVENMEKKTPMKLFPSIGFCFFQIGEKIGQLEGVLRTDETKYPSAIAC